MCTRDGAAAENGDGPMITRRERSGGAPAGWATLAGWTLALAALASMVVEWVAGALSKAPYSFLYQAASDLAATTCGPMTHYEPPREVCSPAHAWVNGVWIVAGLLMAVTVVALRRRIMGVRRPRTAVWSVGLLAAGGVCQAAVGFVPVDADLAVHTILALIGFLAQNVGLVLAGPAVGERNRALAVSGVVGGLIGLVSLVLFVAPTAWGLPLGLVERVSMYPYPLWLVAAGLVAATRRGS